MTTRQFSWRLSGIVDRPAVLGKSPVNIETCDGIVQLHVAAAMG
jgi:hypothetical protein